MEKTFGSVILLSILLALTLGNVCAYVVMRDFFGCYFQYYNSCIAVLYCLIGQFWPAAHVVGRKKYLSIYLSNL